MLGDWRVPAQHMPITLEATYHNALDTLLLRLRVDTHVQVFKTCVEWPGVVSSNREEQSRPQGQVKFKIVVTHPL